MEVGLKIERVRILKIDLIDYEAMEEIRTGCLIHRHFHMFEVSSRMRESQYFVFKG